MKTPTAASKSLIQEADVAGENTNKGKMPSLHRHTHCQIAPADTQAETWQRVCLHHRATDIQSGRMTVE